MKRRDLFRLVPFAVPAALGAKAVFAQTMPQCPRGSGGIPEPLGMMYTRRVREMLQWVRANQSENILEASYAIARAVERGNRVWGCWDLGHTQDNDLFPERNGQPDIVTTGYIAEEVKDGDVILANYPKPKRYIEDMAKKNVLVVGGPAPWGGDLGEGDILPDNQQLQIRPYADIWIDMPVDLYGAQVKVPSSPALMGPESGPLSSTIFWMMMADACRVLARDGKTAPVKGDEPPLTEKAKRAGLDVPLMDDFYDEVMREIEMIGMEMGSIRKMAGLVTDSLLAGGNVYFYSRHYNSLAGEAVGRRGGFAFAKGLSGEKAPANPSPKDCVIMGTYKPDDEVDLRNIQTFKKLGMKVGTIGPVTRDAKPVDGKTVCTESDVHAGRMMDTYGLFALPGFERKVCPTSGIMNISILWALSGEVIEQVMERTGGDVPAIYFNGALRWGGAYNERMNAIAKTRGY